MASKGCIVAVGPNPAWQKTLFFDEFEPGRVNRCADIMRKASGKAVNFVRAARSLGFDSVVCQFAGGRCGDALVEDLDAEGIVHRTVRVLGETRTCSTCVCRATGRVTELIEPSDKVSLGEVDSLAGVFSELSAQCAGAALCGTTPPGAEKLYASILERKRAFPVLLDSSQGALDVLKAGVDFFKVNTDEIRALTGYPNALDAAEWILREYGLTGIGVTDGPGNAIFVADGAAWSFQLPSVSSVVNPIGAGDTVSAVFLCEILSGRNMVDAFRSGLAAGTASCLTSIPAVFDTAVHSKVFDDVLVRKT